MTPSLLQRSRRMVWLIAALALGSCSHGAANGSGEGAAQESAAPKAEPGAAFVVPEPEPAAPGGETAATRGSSSVRHAYSNARVSVRDDSVRVTVTEVLVNTSNTETKVSYGFPLPRSATVAGFADYRDGRRVEATLASREAARTAFDAAEQAGARAALTERDQASGFRMDLTPLSPHESRRVELSYVQTLRPLGSERTFVYPAGRTLKDSATVSELELELTGGRSLGAISCPNQPGARVERRGDRQARVTLDGVAALPQADVVVRWTEAAEALDLAIRGARAKPDEPAYVEARFSFTRDPHAGVLPPRGFVLVLDTSLSMAGDSLERARELMQGIARNLTDRDQVGLITFAGELRSWNRAEPATAATRRRLLDELALTRAGGASDLEAAIDRARELLTGLPDPVLVIATDGQATVGDDLDTLSPDAPAAAFEGTDVRVALFNYPSRQRAVEALFPHVTTEYVPSGPAGEDSVARLASLISAPRIENVRLTVDGLEAKTQRGKVPALLALGDSLRVTGRAAGGVSVKLSGKLHGRPVMLERRLESAPLVPDDPLPGEWARQSIEELQEVYRKTSDPAVRDQIIALGTEHHLVTSLTSLIAADSLSPDRVMPGDPEIRVAAARSATAVRAQLPWGESVECEWNADEQLWYGRFLVPRSVADGLYRVRVFVDFQGVTRLRTTLLFRVDSRPPLFSLSATRHGDDLRLEAVPVRDVFDSDRNGIRKDRVDVRSLVVRLGSRSVPLARVDDDRWAAEIPADPAASVLVAEVVATDYALNVSRTRHELRVSR